MFHVGRSGSRVLGDLFRQHPQVYWDGEVYGRLFQKRERELGHEAAAGNITDDPIAHLQSRVARHWQGDRVYGFEAKFFHLDIFELELADFLQRLDTLGFERFIVLERKNTLRKVISSLIAHKTGRCYLMQGQQAAPVRVYIDVNRVAIDRTQKTLLQFLSGYAEGFQKLEIALCGRPVLHLTYEDDVSRDPLIAYRRICPFLNLVPTKPAVRLRKTNPFELGAMIENLEEVIEYLHGTPFEWMIGTASDPSDEHAESVDWKA